MGMNPLIKYEFHDTINKGSVIRTDPAANTELKDGQTVWLVCSSGPVIEKAEMPKLVGMSYAEAKAELELLGFTGDISYVRRESDEPRDEVIEQPYKRGELVDITEDIVLTISKGPKETEPPKEKPTEEPENEQEEPVPDVTKTVTIELPADREQDYVLGLFLNGRAVLEETVITAGTASIDVTLTGSGIVYYDLHINGSYFRTEKVEFS
jgi:beta-lactam-binding protein with PASTA domain